MNRNTLVIFFVGLLLSFIIFIFTYNNKLDYLAIGDELVLGATPFESYNKSYSDYFSIYLNNKHKLKTYNTSFSKKDNRITDILNDISQGNEVVVKNKKVNINQLIVTSDIITISIGQAQIHKLLKSNYKNSRLNNINNVYKYIDELNKDYVKLLSQIRKISDSDIYIIGYFNPLTNANQKATKEINKIIEYTNKRFKDLEVNKNIYFINISEGFKEKGYYLPNVKKPYPSTEGYNYIANKLIYKYELNNYDH